MRLSKAFLTGRPCIEKPFMPDQIRKRVEEIARQARGVKG